MLNQQATLQPLVPERFLDLPDILPDIYSEHDSLDVVARHILTLERELHLSPGNTNARFMKIAFEQYHHCVSLLGQKHRELFFNLHQDIVRLHSNLFIKTLARTKSVLRFYQKCRRHLFKGKAISDISDIFAARIIIDSKSLSDEELISLCYVIANEAINFMLSQGYMPVESTGVKDADAPFDQTKFPGVFIPKESLLAPEYIKFCKDYIRFPKTLTAYQSLHIVFANSIGERLELQIRTFDMDNRAENNKNTKHEYYEELQDSDIPKIPIDRSKVCISGYSYRYGELHDDSGLEKSSPCMQEIHRGRNPVT